MYKEPVDTFAGLKEFAATANLNLIERNPLDEALQNYDDYCRTILTKVLTDGEYTPESAARYVNNFIVEPTFNLSQSAIKSFWDVAKGNICGRKFIASMHDWNVSLYKQTDAMVLGQLFEYYSTGQGTLHGNIPDNSIILTKKGEFTDPGKRMMEHAEIFKEWLTTNNFTNIETGKTLKFKTADYKLTVHPDIICKQNGKTVVIDLKYSDPDSTFGDFAWHPSKLAFNKKLLIQARQTQFIMSMNGEGHVPFIFYIADKSDSTNARAILVELKDFEKAMFDYETFIRNTYKTICMLEALQAFEITPEPAQCANCIVACSKRTKLPVINKLFYN